MLDNFSKPFQSSLKSTSSLQYIHRQLNIPSSSTLQQKINVFCIVKYYFYIQTLSPHKNLWHVQKMQWLLNSRSCHHKEKKIKMHYKCVEGSFGCYVMVFTPSPHAWIPLANHLRTVRIRGQSQAMSRFWGQRVEGFLTAKIQFFFWKICDKGKGSKYSDLKCLGAPYSPFLEHI